jgi:hypothetical protein
MHEKSLAIEEQSYGGAHPEMGEPLLGIGLAEVGLRQPAKAIAALERAEKIANLRRRLRGQIRLALAQALEAGRGGEPARVRSLLTAARVDFQIAPQVNVKELGQIDAWLARHPQ